ncbi:polymeric immunoglobulin receptor [Sardina pilchardus]|uniref:polymeric immunoglobulin receptor n=1 Tax=Sardina pilchardus TaxID=27697 RepID=UPI002E1231F2
MEGMLFFRIALLLVHGFQGVNSLWTVSRVAVQKGGSITIPCHYHRMFQTNEKYWCKGRSWGFCKEIARTTSKSLTEGVSITDYPSEQVFTITKTKLEVKDADRYWCALIKRGFSRNTLRTSLELQVTEGPPDLFVMDNRVSVEEGGNVSIPCMYGDGLKSAEKKWCESGKLHSCRSALTTSPLEAPSVTIADDGNGVFTVTLMKLERKDTGWYWCSADDLQAPVHINVTERLDTFTVTTSGGVTSEITHTISSAPPSFQPTTPSQATSTASKTTSHTLLTPTPQVKTSTTPSAVLTSTVSNTSANGGTSDTSSATITPTDFAPTCAFNNTCSTVPSNTTEDTAIHNRHLIWQSVAIVMGIVMAVVIIVGASLNCWRHHKRRHTRIELDDMTHELNIEEELEDDVRNDWPRSCLLYHEDTESDGTL